MHSPISAAPPHPHPLLGRQPTFRGQQADEVVVALRRPALLALLLPGWPLWLGMLLLGGVVLGQTSGGLPGPVAATLSVPLALVTLASLFHWAVTHALPWWFRLGIVTNQRIIFSSGIIRARVADLPLETIQVVEVVQPNLIETLLGYGRVKVASGGGDPLIFTQIARPRAFAATITDAQGQHAAPRRPSPRVDDTTLHGVLERMGQGETLPPMPTLDPRLTRDWPLRHALALKLPADEIVLGMVSRHWWALAARAGGPLALIVGAALVALVGGWG
ncbi:MAG: PH domain-containing protein, partial [Ktedonobacterales bacterium]|nr:PH domain-containing protein [Ktedonobacterales bacterium]